MTRPDIRNAPLALRALVIEPVDEVIIGSRRYKFDLSWHPELEAELQRMSTVVGFGPIVVQSCANKEIASKNTAGTFEFLPSDEWCRWFLRKCNYVARRKTGHRHARSNTPTQSGSLSLFDEI